MPAGNAADQSCTECIQSTTGSCHQCRRKVLRQFTLPYVKQEEAPLSTFKDCQVCKKTLNPDDPCSCLNTRRKRFFFTLGYVFSAVIAFGSGVTTSAAFVSLGLVSGGATYALAALLFSAGALMNWYIQSRTVPKTLLGIFGQGWPFQDMWRVFTGYELELISNLPEKDPSKAKAGKIYLSPEGGYVVRDRNGRVQEGSLDVKSIDLSNLSTRLQDESLKSQILEILSGANVSLTKPLSSKKKRKLGLCIAVVLALAVGATNGLLSYGSIFTLTSAFSFLAVISPAFPAIASVLAAVTLVSLAALMFSNFYEELIKENFWGSLKQGLKKLFSFDFEQKAGEDRWRLRLTAEEERVRAEENCQKNSPLEQTQDNWLPSEGKTWRALVAERVLNIVLTCVALPLAGLGLFMTMNASAAGAKVFFLKNIPQASALVVEITSKSLTLVLALLGRIPFTFKNSLKTIAKWTGKKSQEELAAEKKRSRFAAASLLAKIWYGFKWVMLNSFALINAVGMGLVSLVGGGGPGNAHAVAGAVGGTWVSFTAARPNLNLEPPVGEPLPPPRPLDEPSPVSSTVVEEPSPQNGDGEPSLSYNPSGGEPSICSRNGGGASGSRVSFSNQGLTGRSSLTSSPSPYYTGVRRLRSLRGESGLSAASATASSVVEGNEADETFSPRSTGSISSSSSPRSPDFWSPPRRRSVDSLAAPDHQKRRGKLRAVGNPFPSSPSSLPRRSRVVPNPNTLKPS